MGCLASEFEYTVVAYCLALAQILVCVLAVNTYSPDRMCTNCISKRVLCSFDDGSRLECVCLDRIPSLHRPYESGFGPTSLRKRLHNAPANVIKLICFCYSEDIHLSKLQVA